MRETLPQARSAQSVPWEMPPPVGGWNARDALAKMPVTDAIQLDNWFPSTTEVAIRQGSAAYATLPTGQNIFTLLNCAKQDGTQKRFAATNSGIYDISAGGASGAAVYALTDGKVEYLNINIAGVPWLWCCNGVDEAFVYRSDTNIWQVINSASTPALTGLTPSTKVTNVSLFKSRVILVEKDSLRFWYLPLNSMGGAAASFDLGQVFRRGGYLVACANWTLDAGDGVDDRFVAISSEGEVAIYQGTDPSSAAAFSLVGVYYVGKPIGKRCCVQFAGDLVMNTEQGVWPLSRALESSTIDRRQALTDKIRNAFSDAFKLYGANFGWQPLLFPAGPAFLVNVPITATVSQQYVMNTISGAWCKFTNWDATCLMVSGGNLYSAMGNVVLQRWTGTADVAGTIVGYVRCAFTRGRGGGNNQHVKLVRPVLRVSAPVIPQFNLDTNFAEDRIFSSQTNSPPGSLLAQWDVARWDQAFWGGSPVASTGWKTVAHKPGKMFSFVMRLSVRNITASWPTTDFIIGVGGLLS